ncbi:hypothetical protein ACWIGI_24190 [Nocardia sp. NPDC055321]
MIAYLAQNDAVLICGWVLVFLIPGGALLLAILWPDGTPPERSVENILRRLERERAGAPPTVGHRNQPTED